MFRSALLLQVLLAAIFLRPAAAAEVQQTLQLNYGWNAVWLEVEPRYAVGDTVRNDAGDPNDDEVLAAGDPRVGGPKLAQDVFHSDTF
ncbi:MAG: hypothetical protein GWO24_22220, partial [Akkermansiaceae bacterium]|nr:hypothetical protein [Akkermansiaceae bacterium]